MGSEASKQARKNGDIEALADAMRALKNLVEQNRTVMSFVALRIPVQHIVDQGTLSTLSLNPKDPFGYC